MGLEEDVGLEVALVDHDLDREEGGDLEKAHQVVGLDQHLKGDDHEDSLAEAGTQTVDEVLEEYPVHEAGRDSSQRDQNGLVGAKGFVDLGEDGDVGVKTDADVGVDQKGKTAFLRHDDQISGELRLEPT